MPRKSRKNVGLIGLGIIGTRVAAVLRSAGFHVFVWTRTPKAVPNFLGSPTEVAEICEVIQLFVSDAQAVIDTIESFGEALTSNHVIVNCATIGPEATREAALLVQKKGAAFLDCPFTGSKIAAEKAQLCYYVGGDDAVFQRVKPILEASSRAIVRCGKIGNAATLKIATNLLTAVTTQTLAEALAIVQKSGIAPEVFGAAIEQNACKSGVTELKLPKMVRGDFDPHFSLKHMFKDVQLGIHLANSFDLEVPVTTVTAGVMYGALNNGWADLDFSSIFRIYSDLPQDNVAALPQPAKPQQIEDKKEETPAPAPELKTAGPEIVQDSIIEPAAPKPPETPKPTTDTFPPRTAPMPEIGIGDIFKRRSEEPAKDQKKEEVPVEEMKVEIVQEPRVPEVIKSESEHASDIPEVIFGRAVPMATPHEPVQTKAKGGGSDLESISADLEKTVIPPPIPADDMGSVINADEFAPKSESEASEKAQERSNGAGSKAEDKPKEEEPPRFRPLQRIRRFFSPAGK